MKQKEYETLVELIACCHGIRNTFLYESKGKELDEFDKLVEAASKILDGTDLDKAVKQLQKTGIDEKTKIVFGKSVKSQKSLPAKKSLGACVYVEEDARFFVKGKAKWIELPWVLWSSAKEKKFIPAELLQEL